MKSPDRYFSRDGWSISDEIIHSPGTGSVAFPDLPSSDFCKRFEKFAEGEVATVAWRNLLEENEEVFSCAIVTVRVGFLDRIISDHLVEPLVLVVPNRRMFLFKDAFNDLTVFVAPMSCLELVVGLKYNSILNDFRDYAEALPVEGQLNYQKAEAKYFRRQQP